MSITKDTARDEKQERRRLTESNWTELRFLPTPVLLRIPYVLDWRFSPTGRLGVNILRVGTGFSVILMDIHNQLWFASSLAELDIKYKDIFTYHMLNENILILVEIQDIYMVKQHVVLVNLETREAEYLQTVVHQFHPRNFYYETTPWERTMNLPCQHVPVIVNKKDYTALVSSNNLINKRRFMYLVPRNPLNPDIQPMEFQFSTMLSNDDQSNLEKLAGSSYHSHTFFFPVFSSAGLLHLSPSITITAPDGLTFHHMLGVYLTIDAAKLIDIYDKRDPVDPMLQEGNWDAQQVDAVKMVLYPFEKKLVNCAVRTSCGTYGSFVFLKPWETDPLKKICTTIHILQSMRTMTIERDGNSWFCLHPCGALLTFQMSSSSLWVKVASVYNNTLESIANSKAIFDQNRPIGTIEGLHQMVFHGLKPIPLDEKARKALGTYDEYINMLGYKNSCSSKSSKFKRYRNAGILLTLGIPLVLIMVVILPYYFIQKYF